MKDKKIEEIFEEKLKETQKEELGVGKIF